MALITWGSGSSVVATAVPAILGEDRDGVIRRDELADDPRFCGAARRLQNREVLDSVISVWSMEHDDYDAMHRLQAGGVPAAAVLNNAQLATDPHLKERGFCVTDRHPEVGERTIAGVSWHLSRTPGSVRTHAPLLGEHNWEIFNGLLGMDADEISGLVKEKVIY